MIGRGSERGTVTGLAIMMAVISALYSYVLWQLVTTASQHARHCRQRSAALYAAEAGLVWAQQQMFAGLGGCFASNPDISVDHDGIVATPAIPVNIIAAPCPGPGVQTRLSAIVNWVGRF